MSLVVVDPGLTGSNSITFEIENEVIKVNGAVVDIEKHNYVVEVGDSVDFECDIVNLNGGIQSQIDQSQLSYPPVLALPLIKVVDKNHDHAVDLIYMRATVTNGKMKGQGKFTSAGNWLMTNGRVNEALDSINAHWNINIPKISFMVVEVI